MLNFLSKVDVDSGQVPGCLTPAGASPAIYHAKPVVVQAAWIAATAPGGNVSVFAPFAAAMLALDRYWDGTARDTSSGLYAWHDQLESGADNLITSLCPSRLGSGPPENASCWTASQRYTLAAPDLATFLHREKVALSYFMLAFGRRADAKRAAHSAAALAAAVRRTLWDDDAGVWTAHNVSTGVRITARTHLLGFPAFGGPALATSAEVRRAVSELMKPDLLSRFGVRSASTSDPRFTNANYVKPYCAPPPAAPAFCLAALTQHPWQPTGVVRFGFTPI